MRSEVMTTLTKVATVMSMTTAQTTSNLAQAEQHHDEAHVASSRRQSYHELGGQHVVELDVLEQLKLNLSQLEDLHLRMKFMMSEISYLLRKA
jgi:hypothetical protein